MGRKSFETEEKLAVATELDLARLAAFIDGEGSIAISVQKPRDQHKSRRHNLSVCISNTSFSLMLWLKDKFGGSVYSSSWGRAKAIYRWQLNERQAEAVLLKCLPFFIIKQEQARLGLAFKATKFSKGWRGTFHRVPESVLLERDEFMAKIRESNRANSVKAIQ